MLFFRTWTIFGWAVISLCAAIAAAQTLSGPPKPLPAVDGIVLNNAGDWVDKPDGQFVGYNSANLPNGYQSIPNCESCNTCSNCEDCATHGMYAFVGYEAFRSVVNGAWGNNGINGGANFATRLGSFSDWTDIGFQIGGSVAPTTGREAIIASTATIGRRRKASLPTAFSAGPTKIPVGLPLSFKIG